MKGEMCWHWLGTYWDLTRLNHFREIQLCAQPATQLTCSPCFRQISYASPLRMRENLNERGLLYQRPIWSYTRRTLCDVYKENTQGTGKNNKVIAVWSIRTGLRSARLYQAIANGSSIPSFPYTQTHTLITHAHTHSHTHTHTHTALPPPGTWGILEDRSWGISSLRQNLFHLQTDRQRWGEGMLLQHWGGERGFRVLCLFCQSLVYVWSAMPMVCVSVYVWQREKRESSCVRLAQMQAV